MPSKVNIFLLVFVLILGKVSLSTCTEVVSVKRSYRDSFRVGKLFGCLNDSTVCTTRSATCQSDGSCLCTSSRRTFRNPVIEIKSGKLVYGNNTYGCVNNQYIRYGVGK